jgi:hypothetical protein
VRAEPNQTELGALESYLGHSRGMNSYLRSGTDLHERNKKEIEHLDGFLNRQSLPEKATVFRGVTRGIMEEKIESLNKGDVLFDKGFTSTSQDKKIAQGFDHTMMRITVPEGSKAAQISKYGQTDYVRGEKEVLFARNSRLRFDGKRGGYYNFTLMEHA